MEDLLNKYWQGTATKEELTALYKLISDSDQSLKLQLEQEFHDEIEAGGQRVQHVDFDMLRKQIRKKIGLEQPAEIIQIASGKRRLIARISVAASLLIIVFSAYYYFTASPKNVLLADKTADQLPGPLWVSISSKDDDSTFILPDSSRLTLLANSTIQYDTAFNLTNRVVYLESGSLSVAVKKNKALPFSVIADYTKTTALGTVFKVSKNKDRSVLVHLLEGVVDVKQRLSGNRVVTHLLRPGEQLWMNEQDNRLTKAPAKSRTSGFVNPLGKKKPAERVIRSEQENLGTIIKVLEDRFNISIHAAESVRKNTWFSGEFRETDSVATILEMICLINQLQLITINEKEFEIKIIKP